MPESRPSPTRIMPFCLASFVLAKQACGLWSPVPPKDTLWEIASRSRVLLVRTGDARLDDGIEEGFRKSWTRTPWSWTPDSGIAAVAKDSNVLVVRLFEPRSILRKSAENDCGKLSGAEGKACRDDQSKGVLVLYIAGEKLGLRSRTPLLLQPTQIRQLDRGDAFAIDIVSDFALVFQAIQDSAYPAEGPLAKDNAWARETLTKVKREKAAGDTLWVPRAISGKVDEVTASASLGAPVRFVGMDTLESMMGTTRTGSYLEAGLRPAATRQLRVRDLASGELLAIDDAKPLLSADTLLKKEDLVRLYHRYRPEEERATWMVSGGYEGSYTELMGYVFTAGYEFRRGVWALVGYTEQQVGTSDKKGAKQKMGIVGLRYTPYLGWERKGLGSRITFGSRFWLPLGEGDPAEDGRIVDAAPRITLDLDVMTSFVYAGISSEIWLGENAYARPGAQTPSPYSYYREEDDKLDPGGLCFRGGLQFGIPSWRPAPSWTPAKDGRSKP